MSESRLQTTAAGGDPHAVLGVDPGAGDAEIRAAYLALVREHPPDRSPEAFERVRDAYEALRDPVRRARWLLFSIDPGMSFRALLAESQAERVHLGPGPWLGRIQQRLLSGSRGEEGR